MPRRVKTLEIKPGMLFTNEYPTLVFYNYESAAGARVHPRGTVLLCTNNFGKYVGDTTGQIQYLEVITAAGRAAGVLLSSDMTFALVEDFNQ